MDIKDQSDAIGFVNNLWERRNDYKFGLERQWYLNIAWYAGQQNVIWLNDSRQLMEPKVPSWRVRLNINLIQGHIRTLTAKLHKASVEFDVLPATTDEEDIALANIDKQVLEYYWKTLKLGIQSLNFLEWLTITGNAFYKVCWNPEKGDSVKINPEDLLGEYVDENDPDAKSKIKQIAARYQDLLDQQLKIGDVDVEVVSPLDILVDPLATCMEDALYVMTSSLQYIEKVKKTWGKKADEIKPQANEYLSATNQLQLKGKINRLQNKRGSVGTETSEMTIVHELWFKPDQVKGYFKDGRHMVICQGKVLKDEKFPYNHKKLPFIHCKEVEVKGSFWGTSTLEQLMPVQADYNKNRSQMVENRNLMSKPKWFVPRGSGINSNSLTSEPGEVVEHNIGMKPEPGHIPEMPSYVKDFNNLYRQDFEDISGQHEVSRAEAPGQVRSGRGILALIEQDETRLGPVIHRVDESTGELGKHILMLLAQYAKEERIARIVDENDELFTFAFSGKQLIGRNYGRPGVDYFDVRVATIPGMPNSRSAQLGLLDNLIERQVLNPQTDRNSILRLLNIGKVTRILDDTKAQRSVALQENYAMAAGQQVLAKAYQDHDSHLAVLHKYMNSQDYEQLEPNVQNLFLIHEQMHKELAAAKAIEPQVLLRQAQAKMLGVPANEGTPEKQQPKENAQ